MKIGKETEDGTNHSDLGCVTVTDTCHGSPIEAKWMLPYRQYRDVQRMMILMIVSVGCFFSSINQTVDFH